MRRQDGFTLLELVVAMTLMGLVLIMVYGGLRLGMGAWERTERHGEGIENMRLVQEFIRAQLRQSITVFRRDERLGQRVAFDGETERLGLVTPLFTHLGMGGLYVVQFEAVEIDGVGRLRMRWQPYQPNAEADAAQNAGGESILLDRVSGLEWSYFGLVPGGRDPEWLAGWEDTGRRPQLVRLKLNLEGQSWPDLVVALPN